MQLNATRKFARHLVFYLVTPGLFLLLYLAGCSFLHWYDTIGLRQQLFLFFLLFSIIWLAGSGINHLIFGMAKRIAISNHRTGFTLMTSWLLLAIATLLAAWMPTSQRTIMALITEAILVLEAAFYPVLALSRFIR